MRLFDRSFFVYCHQWLILLTSLLFPATKMDIKKLCHINKPLIPLKIMMMLVHGGSAGTKPSVRPRSAHRRLIHTEPLPWVPSRYPQLRKHVHATTSHEISPSAKANSCITSHITKLNAEPNTQPDDGPERQHPLSFRNCWLDQRAPTRHNRTRVRRRRRRRRARLQEVQGAQPPVVGQERFATRGQYCHMICDAGQTVTVQAQQDPATKAHINICDTVALPIRSLGLPSGQSHALASLAANLAFMALHMKSLGISVPETALILTVFPLVAAIGPPAGGALADKLGNYKIVFCLATLLSVALHLMLYFLVPAIPGSTVGAVAVVNITTESPLTLEAWCSLSHGSSAFVYPVGIYNQCPAVNASQPTITFVDVQTQNSTIIQSCWQSPRSVIQADLCQTDTFSSLPSGLRLDQVYEVVKKECAYLHRRHSTVADVKCWYSCAVSAGSNWTCPKNETTPEKADRVTTLASYIALRLTATIAMWLAVPLLDSIAVMMVRQHDSDLGKQRMWSQVGFAATPPVVGALIAYESKRNGFEDYGPSFYVFSAMHLIAAFLVFILKTDKKLPAQSLAKSIGVLFHDRRVISLIMAVFIAGCGFGFLTAFLLWFMEEELHSAKFMLGLTQTIAGLSGILGMFCAGWIIRRIGYTAIFAFGILLYSPRFLALSFVPAGQDYYVQLLQILDGISHGLVMVAAAEYAGKLSPKYVASLQGIIFAAHYCFGKGGGSLMGGLLYNKFGPRMSFRIYSMIYASLFVVYAVSHYFIVARPHQRRKSELKARNSDASAEQALLEAQNSEKSDGPPTNLPSIYRDLDQKPINGFGHSSPHEDEAIHSLGYEKNAEFR